MAKFLSQLNVTRVGPELWSLASPLQFQSDLLGQVITVPVGFVTDFASVPRLPFAYLLFGGVAEEAATLHDWLYFSARVSRRRADQLFLEASVASGVARWRARTMYVGLRLFGGTRYGVGSNLV